MRANKSILMPPLIIVRGQQEAATYREQIIPEYRGNPLIEALPEIWTREKVQELLSYYPPYSEGHRSLPNEIRLHLLENAREFFIPQGIHLEIEIKISCMIRRGYIERNPTDWEYWKGLNNRLETLASSVRSGKVFLRSKPRGFAIVGTGGMGKSTAVENILSHYPQVIVHTWYQEKDFIFTQLVWLKLECPRDGSTRGLCLNFFQAVDDIIGTGYYERYRAGRRGADELIPEMARVASLHGLGLLVIDEIQNLSEARSGGSAQMLNFFVQIENTIGVPYILIGTRKAETILKGEFRHARRSSEQGDVIWRRMREIAEKVKPSDEDKADPVWEEFVRALWVYQYTRTPCPLKADLLKDPLAHALYDECRGITAVAVTLYVLAQRRAITTDRDKITAGIIRSVAKDSQGLIQEEIDRIRSGVGLRILSVEPPIEVRQVAPPLGPSASPDDQPGDTSRDAKKQSGVEVTADTDSDREAKGEEKVSDAAPISKKGRKAKASGTQVYEKNDLRNYSQAPTGEVTEDISKADFVRPATEFSEEPGR